MYLHVMPYYASAVAILAQEGRGKCRSIILTWRGYDGSNAAARRRPKGYTGRPY